MISPLRPHRTIARPVTIDGYGYWTCRDISVTFRPAAAGSGYVFVRKDLTPVRRIQAALTNRVDTPRRTTLTENGGTVEMVEHLLAALAGLGIHNCEIEVTGDEMPGGDGSSAVAVAALLRAGIVNQDQARPQVRVTAPIRLEEGSAWIEAHPSTAAQLTIEYQLDYGPGPIGHQTHRAELDHLTFAEELAPARTFVLQHEAEAMKARGLCQRITYRDLLVFGPSGVIENELRFSNECARHKTLDIVGDLALVPFDIHAHIVANRSGHRLNAALAEAVLRQHQATLLQTSSA